MKTLSPIMCESTADLLSLKTSHKSVGDFDMLIQHDQAVIITNHPSGKPCKATIVIPKTTFLKMLDWYNAEQ